MIMQMFIVPVLFLIIFLGVIVWLLLTLLSKFLGVFVKTLKDEEDDEIQTTETQQQF
jgi:hypothetical protein